MSSKQPTSGNPLHAVRASHNQQQQQATGSNDSALVLTFDRAGGLPKQVETAFELADPWKKGVIDRRMAEQAFAQLVMHSDVGMAFSDLAADGDGFMDSERFTEVVQLALSHRKDAVSGDEGKNVEQGTQPL